MSPRKRILSISNDAALLATRTMLLEQAGFEVVPAFGFAEAMELCSNDPSFDLILMGQTIPPKDKKVLIATLKEMNCKAPILSIRRQGDAPLAEADFAVDSHAGPVALVEAAKAALGVSKGVRSIQSISKSSGSQSSKGSSRG
jgi:DNA-binding NtrC family response regulator